MDSKPTQKSGQRSTCAGQDSVPHIPSESLFCNRREVVILHKGREYRLRLTQNDKLILTA